MELLRKRKAMNAKIYICIKSFNNTYNEEIGLATKYGYPLGISNRFKIRSKFLGFYQLKSEVLWECDIILILQENCFL